MLLFRTLQERGLATPRLVISDAHAGLTAAIRKGFPGACWQRCKVHFMRNILAYIPQKEKRTFAQQLKSIWQAPTKEQAYQRAEELMQGYERRFPKAIHCLEEGLEDSLSFYDFPQLDARKISSTNIVGAAEPRNPAPHQGGWNLSQPRCVHEVGYDIPDGICRGLVCL